MLRVDLYVDLIASYYHSYRVKFFQREAFEQHFWDFPHSEQVPCMEYLYLGVRDLTVVTYPESFQQEGAKPLMMTDCPSFLFLEPTSSTWKITNDGSYKFFRNSYSSFIIGSSKLIPDFFSTFLHTDRSSNLKCHIWWVNIMECTIIQCHFEVCHHIQATPFRGLRHPSTDGINSAGIAPPLTALTNPNPFSPSKRF